MDFFNAQGNRVRGKKASTGLISMHCLNLPGEIQHLYPHICMLIQGPFEPSGTELQHYIKLVVDDLLTGVEHGYHISRTASHQVNGMDVEFAMAIHIGNMVANWASEGHISHQSQIFCNKCNAWDICDNSGELVTKNFVCLDRTVMKEWKQLLGQFDVENWVFYKGEDVKSLAFLAKNSSADKCATIWDIHGLQYSKWA